MSRKNIASNYKAVNKIDLNTILKKKIVKKRTTKKLKILYSTVNQRNYVKENREYFKKELSMLPEVEVHFVTEGGEINQIISNLNFMPDFIFIDDLKKAKPITGLDNIDIPKGFLYTDVHGNHDYFYNFESTNKIDLIFSLYRDGFKRFHPNYLDKFVWLPHHVYTPVFHDYKYEKVIDYLLMGVLSKKTYPFRSKIVKRMRNMDNFVYYKHPGYRYFSEEEKAKALIGVNYAKEINKAKIFLTDDSIYNYPIAKYFEVAACNTLILGSGSEELRDLGFIDKKTMVEINEDNFLKKAKYYLENEKERKVIAKEGYDMVRKYHRTKDRVREFVDCISIFIGKEKIYDTNVTRNGWVKFSE